MQNDSTSSQEPSLNYFRPVPEADRRHFFAVEQFDLRHELFRHESLSRMWGEQYDPSFKMGPIKLFKMVTGERVGLDAITVHGIASNPRLDSFRVDLSIQGTDQFGHWLQFRDGLGNNHGVLLPFDESRSRFVIEFHTVNPSTDCVSVSRLGAFVGENSDEPLRTAYRAWERLLHRDTCSAKAILELQVTPVEDYSLLAGLLTSLVASHIDEQILPEECFQNWRMAFPDSPDLAVLFVERLLRTRHDAICAAANVLTQSLWNALPQTIECFSYADTLIKRLLTAAEILSDGLTARLERCASRLSELNGYLSPVGFFVSISRYPDNKPIWRKLRSSEMIKRSVGVFPDLVETSNTSLALLTTRDSTSTIPRSPLWDHIEKELSEHFELIRDAVGSEEFCQFFKAIGAAVLPRFVNYGVAVKNSEELTLETIRRVIFQLDRFQLVSESFQDWCSRIAAVALDDWIQSMMRCKPDSSGTGALDQFANQDFRDSFNENDPNDAARLAFVLLSDEERAIVELRLAENLEFRTISERLEIDVDFVQFSFSRFVGFVVQARHETLYHENPPLTENSQRRWNSESDVESVLREWYSQEDWSTGFWNSQKAKDFQKTLPP